MRCLTFIDNAFGPAAGNAKSCRIEFHPDRVVIIDDGRGIDDMDAMFTLAKSRSRASKVDIGRYGVGAKYAMLHFGDRVDVETVRKRRYHQRSVSWAYVRRSGKWPLAYRSAGKPPRNAPESVRQGGTIITVSALHRGRRRVQMDWLCKRLTHRYLPALRQGRVITIADAAKGVERHLVEDAAAVNLWESDRRSFTGTAAERPFTVMAAMTREYEEALNGLHIAFGHRFIIKVDTLGGRRLPHLFYGEVQLGEEWKDCLSSDKSEIVRHHDELMESLAGLLGGWIDTLREYTEEARIEHINVQIEGALQSLLKVAFEERGSVSPVVVPMRTIDSGKNSSEREDSAQAEPPVIQPPAQPGGDRGQVNKDVRPTGIKYRRDDALGKIPYRAQYDASGLLISLNGKLGPIAQAYERPFKMAALWPLICAAVANLCRRRANDLDDLFPGFEERLGISREAPDEMELRILAWLLEKQPDIKEPALEKVA